MTPVVREWLRSQIAALAQQAMDAQQRRQAAKARLTDFMGFGGSGGASSRAPAAAPSIGRGISALEEEQRRRSAARPKSGKAAPRLRPSGPAARPAASGGGGGRSAPAVVKLISSASGATRAGATATYICRDGVELETHDGILLGDHDAIKAEIDEWSKDFEKRAASHDVASLRMGIDGLKDTAGDRAILADAVVAGFSGHRYLVRIEAIEDDEGKAGIEARLVISLARKSLPEEMAAAEAATLAARVIDPQAAAIKLRPQRLYITEKAVGPEDSGWTQRALNWKGEKRIAEQIEAATGMPAKSITLRPGVAGHGVTSVEHRAGQMLASGPAHNEAGKLIANNPAAIKILSASWKKDLRSTEPRDTIHILVSAKTGTNVEAFTDAVRGFLHEKFSDRKFMFGVHTDKADAGHIHAHVVVTVRNAEREKLNPSRETFHEWRRDWAAQAQERGIDIVATRALHTASSHRYRSKDKPIVEAADRPRPGREARDRAYASEPANQKLIDSARRRIEVARTNPVRIPSSERQLSIINDGLKSWEKVAASQPGNRTAQDTILRLEQSRLAGETIILFAEHLKTSPVQEHKMPQSAADMQADLRELNEVMAEVSAELPPSARAKFENKSGEYLEKVAEMVDHRRATELQAARELIGQETPALTRVVAQARDIAAREEREAIAANAVVAGSVALARVTNANPDAAPAERETAGNIVRDAEAIASREAHEARAAQEALRRISQAPATQLPREFEVDDGLTELARAQKAVLAKDAAEHDLRKASEQEDEQEQ